MRWTAKLKQRVESTVLPVSGLQLQVEAFIANFLTTDARQQDKRSLNHFEFKAFSQSGEDGILREIFRRIGTTSKSFIEIGVGDGTENNTVFLLHTGWVGSWFEANSDRVRSIRAHFGHEIGPGRLRVTEARVSPNNVRSLLREAVGDSQIDLLSLDIDGNDYWVWRAVADIRPRVVVIEYNATWGPEAEWIMAYQPGAASDNTSYHGASLAALNRLGLEMGYSLVACSLSGANAFFVESRLVSDAFMPVKCPADVWQPLRLPLVMPQGHRRAVGPYVHRG
jgi:hypothetical protein